MNKLFSRRTHRHRNALIQGGTGLSFSIVAIVVGLLAIVRFAAPGVFSSVVTPIWSTGARLTSAVYSTATLESKASLRESRDRLEAENAALSAQNLGLTAQVSDLTRLLGGRTESQNEIVAAVLARPPVAPYDVLIIDQGTEAGVVFGARAYGPGGTPIGTIGEAGPKHSRITLYSTQGIGTGAWVGATRIPVTLTGAGSGAFRAELPKSAGVAVGDGVYLPSSGAFPIGTVVSIDADPSSPSVDLEVRPYTNPFSLTWVTIGRE